MNLDITNEQHRKALRTACETLLLPGMPADAAADLAWRADAASPAQLAFLALALPEESAVVVRALLELCGVRVTAAREAKPHRDEPTVQRLAISTEPDEDGFDHYVFQMSRVPALVLRLLANADDMGPMAALAEAVR